MKQWWDEWVKEPFLRALVEVSWFGPVLTAILVALLVNMLTEALTTWGGVGFGFLVWAVLAACTGIFVYLYELARRRRRRKGTALGTPADREHPMQSEGLVFLYTNEAALREALGYHRPMLKYCWLVVTPEMQTAAANVISQVKEVQFESCCSPSFLSSLRSALAFCRRTWGAPTTASSWNGSPASTRRWRRRCMISRAPNRSPAPRCWG